MTVVSSHSVSTVAGSWIDGASVVTGGGLHRVMNPATGEAVAEYALASPGDVDTAVASARAALSTWATATPVDRSAVLFKLAKLAARARRRRWSPRRSARRESRCGWPPSSTCPEVSTTSTSSPAPRATSKARPARSIPPITRRAFAVRRWESSRPSPRGTTRCRWRCGRCCPRWPPAARWSSSRAS